MDSIQLRYLDYSDTTQAVWCTIHSLSGHLFGSLSHILWATCFASYHREAGKQCMPRVPTALLVLCLLLEPRNRLPF